VILGLAIAPQSVEALTLNLNFNSGLDDIGNSTGGLVFNGPGSFQTIFTDDKSGGFPPGIEITTAGPGNLSTDPVFGANDPQHSSGIIANFSQGVTLVAFLILTMISQPRRCLRLISLVG